jgi:hypothetical protein
MCYALSRQQQEMSMKARVANVETGCIVRKFSTAAEAWDWVFANGGTKVYQAYSCEE